MFRAAATRRLRQSVRPPGGGGPGWARGRPLTLPVPCRCRRRSPAPTALTGPRAGRPRASRPRAQRPTGPRRPRGDRAGHRAPAPRRSPGSPQVAGRRAAASRGEGRSAGLLSRGELGAGVRPGADVSGRIRRFHWARCGRWRPVAGVGGGGRGFWNPPAARRGGGAGPGRAAAAGRGFAAWASAVAGRPGETRFCPNAADVVVSVGSPGAHPGSGTRGCRSRVSTFPERSVCLSAVRSGSACASPAAGFSSGDARRRPSQASGGPSRARSRSVENTPSPAPPAAKLRPAPFGSGFVL